MRVLIAGAGRAGIGVAVHLQHVGHDVVVLDRDQAAARQAFERRGIVSFHGDATDATMLRDAEVGKCDIVVAMLRRDADNLAVALLARSAGVKRVMVRMRDPDYRPVYESAGIHRTLSETDIFVGALATAIEHESVRHAMLLGAGTSVAFELVVPPDAAVVGKTVSDVAADEAFPPSCVFAGMIEPDGEYRAPRGGSFVAAGMTLLLVAPRKELARVVQFVMRRAGDR